MPLEALHPARARFASGLRAIVAPMPWVHRAVLTAHIHVGSRYESAADNGISHFLEHMLFRGTQRHPTAHELAVAFEELGGTLVAATAADHGTLAIGVPPESLPAVIQLFGEVFLEPLLSDLDIERGIIREEILEDLNEEGQLIDGPSLARQLTFGDHPLGMPITGTLETLETFSPVALRHHHARHYTAGSTVLAVTGPVDVDATLQALERSFRAIAPGERPATSPPPPQDGPRYRHVQHTASQTALHVAFRGPGDGDPLEPALEMLLRIIDDGMATRLYHRLCDSRGLCYDASASYEAFSDTGLVELGTETAHEHAVEVLDEMLRLTEELAASGPTPEELDRALRRCRWQHQAMLDDPGDVADILALAELTGGPATPRERLAQLEAVSVDQVLTVAQQVFRPANLSVVTVGRQSERARAKLQRRALAG